MNDMLAEFERLIDTNTVSCVDRLELPACTERSVPVPDAYRDGSPGRWLMNDEKLRGRLWLHQAKAMAIAAEGRNLVISTGTASGKSLVFQSAAFRMLDEDNEAAIIVFYPLKALSNDQLMSWRRAAGLPRRGHREGGRRHSPSKSREASAEGARRVDDAGHLPGMAVERDLEPGAPGLARTRLMVVDEAHVLEGVFDSNFAYLFRRLCAARFLVQGKGRRTETSRAFDSVPRPKWALGIAGRQLAGRRLYIAAEAPVADRRRPSLPVRRLPGRPSGTR